MLFVVIYLINKYKAAPTTDSEIAKAVPKVAKLYGEISSGISSILWKSLNVNQEQQSCTIILSYVKPS